jgi:hypothetical protein
MSKNFRGHASGLREKQRRGEKGKRRERMERGGIGLHYFSDQTYDPAGKHTSNNSQ